VTVCRAVPPSYQTALAGEARLVEEVGALAATHRNAGWLEVDVAGGVPEKHLRFGSGERLGYA
jgi:hypothetical protein